MLEAKRQYLIKVHRQGALVAYCTLDGKILQVSFSLFQQAFGMCLKSQKVIGYPIQSLLLPGDDLYQMVTVTTGCPSRRSCLVRAQ